MNQNERRWPLHPKPLWEESLSSWLHRLAAEYWMTLEQWFETVFNEPVPDDFTLDTNPSELLMERLSCGTGFNKNYLHQMTIKGYVPWIIDNLDNRDQFNISTDYCTQNFSLLPWGACDEINCCRNKCVNVTPWLNRKKSSMICLECIKSDPVPYLRIFWRLALFGSCTKHKMRLTECAFIWRDGLTLKKTKQTTLMPADERVLLVDSLSFQAVTTGRVLYSPYLNYNAAIYCRWLRFLISELFCLSHDREDLDHVWYAAGVSLKLGLFENIVYEDLNINDRYRTLIVIGFILSEIPAILNGDKFNLKSRCESVFWPRRGRHSLPKYLTKSYFNIRT